MNILGNIIEYYNFNTQFRWNNDQMWYDNIKTISFNFKI